MAVHYAHHVPHHPEYVQNIIMAALGSAEEPVGLALEVRNGLTIAYGGHWTIHVAWFEPGYHLIDHNAWVYFDGQHNGEPVIIEAWGRVVPATHTPPQPPPGSNGPDNQPPPMAAIIAALHDILAEQQPPPPPPPPEAAPEPPVVPVQPQPIPVAAAAAIPPVVSDAIKSVDQLPVINQFSVLQPVMGDQKLRTSIRLLCVYGYNGQEVMFATDDDRVYGFGANLFGQLGLGVDDQQIIEPQLNTTLTGKAVQTIGFGYGFCVAVTAAGRCYSWGDNKFGQLGVGTKVTSNTPVLIDALGDHHVVDVACGSDHVLLLTADGRVYAMGRNDTGQLGNRLLGPSLTPTHVPLGGLTVASLSCGKSHSLALTESGRVLVWGSNEFGQLGRSREVVIRGSHSVPFTNIPDAVHSLNGMTFKKALCGPNNTLLLSTDGRIFAFGENIYGQIGNGSRNPQFTPHHVSKGLRFKDIVAHYGCQMAIAVTADDKYYVWGHPIDCGFACIPTPVPESATSHTVYDIYAKYSKLILTFKTIVFGSDSKSGSIAMKTTEKSELVAEEIGLSNVCTLYEMSITDGSVELEKSCVQFARNNFKAITKLDSFHELPEQLAKRLMLSAIE